MFLQLHERHEQLARALLFGVRRAPFQVAAPRADADPLAVRNAVLVAVRRVHRYRQLRRPRQQVLRPPRYRPAVPVIQNPPRVQDEREALRRHLVRRRTLIEPDHQRARTAREVVRVQVSRAGVFGVRAGPLYPAFVLQPLVGYSLDYRHQRRHLVEYLGRMRVVELMLQAQLQLRAHPPRDVADDFPVRPALADRLHRLADALNAALAVRERPVLLRERRRRQHHVRQLRRLVHEQVLNDQKIQLAEFPLRPMQIRLAQQRVLAHYVHRVDLAVYGIHHLRNRQPRDAGQGSAAPRLFELRYAVSERLIARQ